jgi:hypothetical protein
MNNSLREIFGSKYWFDENNILHKEDGPAVEHSNGNKYWYYKGKKIDCKTNEEFLRIMKLRLFW